MSMKTKNTILLLFCTFFLSSANLLAQDEIRNEGPVLSYHISYGFQYPGGHMADKFGINFNLSNALEFMTPE